MLKQLKPKNYRINKPGHGMLKAMLCNAIMYQSSVSESSWRALDWHLAAFGLSIAVVLALVLAR